jgi:hypothetical protein
LHLFFAVLNPLAAPSWLPHADFVVESASSVIFVRPLSFDQRAFFANKKDCNFRAPLGPRFFNVVDIASSFIALFIYFSTVFNPEYFVILLPVNECFTTFDWPFNFFFVFFILKVMFFVETLFCNDMKISI